jgi:hypothetical protein
MTEKSFEKKKFFWGPHVAFQNQQNFGTQISIAFIWYFQKKISKFFLEHDVNIPNPCGYIN